MSNNEEGPRYDVALSLLSADEGYARQLEQEIRKVVRGEVFLYSRRQDELAASGELVDTFTRIFREKARVVVVLFRPGWGGTGYTGVEQEAIKTRRLRENSFRFLVIVAVEPPQIPDWYPSSEFWLTPDTFSPEAIAAVVADRVHSAGGTVGKESALDLALRLKRKEEERRERQSSFEQHGLARLEDERSTAFALLQDRIAELEAAGIEALHWETTPQCCEVQFRGLVLQVRRRQRYGNSARDAGLRLTLHDWHSDAGSDGREVFDLNADLALEGDDSWGWKPIGSSVLKDREFLTTEELVEWALSELIRRGHEDPSQRSASPFVRFGVRSR